MANPFDSPTAPAAVGRKRPIILPGFDRVTQLRMDFNTLQFSTAWLRKTYTSEHARSIQMCLTGEDQHRRERRLQEVRYGNNIALLFKASYLFRDCPRHGDLFKAIARVYGVRSEVVESVIDLFVEARAVFIKNYHPGDGTTWVKSGATHWVDRWVLFLDGRDDRTPEPVFNVYAAVDDFFRQEEQAKNGDLSRILLTSLDVEPPPWRPRALRKRSPSPCALESSPAAKKRAISTSTDGTGTQATLVDFGGKEEPRDSVCSTNGRQRADYLPDRGHRDDPCFQKKIRGIHNSPTYQDRPSLKPLDCEDDDFEAFARSSARLRARVDFLEKERLESIQAQNDRDNAIRTLQARFTAFEKAAAAANAQIAAKDKLLVPEMQEMREKLGAQAEKLQEMGKQLESSQQTARSMQTTISSLQEELARRAQTEFAVSEDKKRQERCLEDQKREFSEMLVRVASLEAKNVFFNDLHKTMREMRAEIAAQKNAAATPPPEPNKESNEQVTSTRLRATEEALEKQDQTVQRAMDRLLILEDQALKRNARIVSLETRTDLAKDISRLWKKVSTLDQTQVNNLKPLDAAIQALRTDLEQRRGELSDLSNRFDNALGGLPTIQNSICEMDNKITHIEEHGTEVSKRLHGLEVSQEALTQQDHSARIDQLDNKITHIEEHGTEVSKRLHGLEVSQEALTQQDHSARIDELVQSIETLKKVSVSLAKADDARDAAIRAELMAYYQNQIAASQQEAKQASNADEPDTRMVQRLTQRLNTIDWMLEKHLAESREKFDQLFGVDARGRNMGRGGKEGSNVSAAVDSLRRRVGILETGKESSNVAAAVDSLCRRVGILETGKEGSNVAVVVDSLCRRVGIMENGFEVMRDVICARRR